MAFPSNPLDGDEYTDPVSKKQYVFSSSKSTWRPKERRKIEEFSSVDPVSTQSPTVGETLHCSTDSFYSSEPGISRDYQPYVTTATLPSLSLYSKNGVDGILPGSMVVTDDGYTSLMGDQSGPFPVVESLLGVSASQKPVNWATTSSSGTLSYSNTLHYFSFRYSGDPCDIAYVRIGKPKWSGTGSWCGGLFKGTTIDLNNDILSTQRTRSVPNLVAHNIGSGVISSYEYFILSFSRTSSSDLGTLDGVLLPGQVYTFAFASRTGTNGVPKYVTYTSSQLNSPSNIDFLEISPTIVNSPYSISQWWSPNSSGKISLGVQFFGNVPTSPSSAYQSPYVRTSQWNNKTGDYSVSNKVDIVSSLPAAQPWYGYPDGYSVFNTTDSTLYTWESSSGTWQTY